MSPAVVAGEPDRALFWEKVDKNGPVPAHVPELGPCWVWIGATGDRGYGIFWVDGKVRRAHRVSYELAHGSCDPKLDVLHRCDNPICVRPGHLRLGTKAENAQDREDKGRGGSAREKSILGPGEVGVSSAAGEAERMTTATVAYEPEQAMDFDSIEAVLEHERPRGVTKYVTTPRGAFLYEPTAGKKWRRHKVFKAKGKYHVSADLQDFKMVLKLPTGARDIPGAGEHVCESGCGCGPAAMDDGELAGPGAVTSSDIARLAASLGTSRSRAVPREEFYRALRSELLRHGEDVDHVLAHYAQELELMRAEGIGPAEAAQHIGTLTHEWTPEEIEAHNRAARQQFVDVEREAEAERVAALQREMTPDPVVSGQRSAYEASVQAAIAKAASLAGVQFQRAVPDPDRFENRELHGTSAQSFILLQGSPRGKRVARVVVFVDKTRIEPLPNGRPVTFSFGHGDYREEERVRAFVLTPEQEDVPEHAQKLEAKKAAVRAQHPIARAHAEKAARQAGIEFDQVMTTGQVPDTLYTFRMMRNGELTATVRVDPKMAKVVLPKQDARAARLVFPLGFSESASEVANDTGASWGVQYMQFLGQWAATYGGYPYRLFPGGPEGEQEARAFVEQSNMTGSAAYEDVSIGQPTGTFAADRAPSPGYWAVDPTGRFVAGPYPAYGEAKPYADALQGWVQFEAGEGAYEPPSQSEQMRLLSERQKKLHELQVWAQKQGVSLRERITKLRAQYDRKLVEKFGWVSPPPTKPRPAPKAMPPLRSIPDFPAWTTQKAEEWARSGARARAEDCIGIHTHAPVDVPGTMRALGAGERTISEHGTYRGVGYRIIREDLNGQTWWGFETYLDTGRHLSGVAYRSRDDVIEGVRQDIDQEARRRGVGGDGPVPLAGESGAAEGPSQVPTVGGVYPFQVPDLPIPASRPGPQGFPMLAPGYAPAAAPRPAPAPAPGPSPAAQALAAVKFKGLHWHRDPAAEGVYNAEQAGFGKFVITKRTPDRRNGVLPWIVRLGNVDIGQGDTKGDAQGVANKYVRNAIRAAKGAPAIRMPKAWPRGLPKPGPEAPAQADCIAVVERNPNCQPNGVDADSAKAVFNAVKERFARQGHESIEVIGVSKQGEMIGSPVQIVVGQRANVSVDLEQILAASVKLVEAGAAGIWLIHNHPSGHTTPSAADRQLTKMVQQGFRIALPNTKFKGHLVIGSKDYATA